MAVIDRDALLRELLRAKATFQLRAIAAVLGADVLPPIAQARSADQRDGDQRPPRPSAFSFPRPQQD